MSEYSDDELSGVKQIASELGICERTVYRILATDNPPPTVQYRPGGRRYASKQQLQKWKKQLRDGSETPLSPLRDPQNPDEISLPSPLSPPCQQKSGFVIPAAPEARVKIASIPGHNAMGKPAWPMAIDWEA